MEASKTMVKAAVDSWLKPVYREKWVTISKIAVPLKVGAAMAAESGRVLDLILCESLSVQNINQRMGSCLAACMWIYTKAVLCDGRRRDPPQDLQPKLGIVVESVSCVTEDPLWEHEWITETNVTLTENVILEALNYGIDVPCPLQWGLLWFSAPTNLNRKFVNGGVKVAEFWDTVSSAIELTCNIAFDGAHN